ncbi:hypothetical protein BDR22DRAFT_819715 [Usnea florida]
MKTIEALGLVGWLILQLSACTAAAPPLTRPDQSPPSLNLIQLPTTVLDPTTNLSNTNNSGTISESPPQHSRGHLENVNLDFYNPEMVFFSRHPEMAETALYRALEDVADHAGSPSQSMGSEMRFYSSQNSDNGAAVDIVLWPEAVAVMTWEITQRLGHCHVHAVTDTRSHPDDALTVQENRTDRSSRRWKHTLIAMNTYALRYPRYDFRFDIWVRETMQRAGTGLVKTRYN